MTRQQLRDNKRREEKIRNKVYTYEEMCQVTKVAILDAQREYDVNYSLCLAASLSAPPFNFGKKRVCNVLKLFFDQIEGLNNKTIDIPQLRKESERLGVFVKNDKDQLSIYLDLDKTLIY